LELENLIQHIEALIFTAAKPVKPQEIMDCLLKTYEIELDDNTLDTILKDLLLKYTADQYSFRIVNSGGGYQFLTKTAYHETVAAMLHQNAKKQLTTAALETLAIIAYKQPITKSQIEQIRGVNSDYSVNKLMEKELVEIVGRANEVGKPLLYGTSPAFMDYFGINALDELPKVKEFEDKDNEIGMLPEIDKYSDN
jgi:segregation and condensation protein B